MIIKSPFKDYYDFVANMYGGGDPKILYLRTKLKAPTSKPHEFSSDTFHVDFDSHGIPSVPRDISMSDDTLAKFKWLFVAGVAYLTYVRLERGPHHMHYSDYGQQYRVVTDRDTELLEKLNRSDWLNNSQPTRVTTEALINLSRLISAPVFAFGSQYSSKKASVAVNCPILKDYGFAGIMPPEQLYQDLSYYVGNVMHPSPDMMPATENSDANKVIAHGFDPKVSFRPTARK